MGQAEEGVGAGRRFSKGALGLTETPGQEPRGRGVGKTLAPALGDWVTLGSDLSGPRVTPVHRGTAALPCGL